jgi:hypothetical protein
MANVKLFQDMSESEKKFCFAFKWFTNFEFEIFHGGYSGRSMYGSKCFAYTTEEDFPDPFGMIIFGKPNSDSMGINGKVFYWPDIEWHNNLLTEDENMLALEYAVENDKEDDPDLTDDWDLFMGDFEDFVSMEINLK